MKKVLFPFALLGWLASLAVHISFLNGYDVSKDYPMVMALHLGVFTVWFPMVFILRGDEELKQFQQSSGVRSRLNPANLFRILYKNSPPFLKAVAVAGFIYAPLNFILATSEASGEPHMLRMFSGHWIAFYGISLGVLYPFNRSVVL